MASTAPTDTTTPFDELVDGLPVGAVITDVDVIASYRQDWARDPSAGTPRAVVRATSTEDVQHTIRWASRHRVPVVTRGAGTGLSGGATAVDDGIVLTLERMADIRIDPAARVALTQAGAVNGAVKRAAAEHGLWYPPDPSSFETCTVGGNAATNAGGLCCVKYGVTTDYVLGMEVVLADGTAVRLGGPRLKDSAGLSLTKIFIGSEGTLGVITGLTLRLLPAQPPPATVVALFATVGTAVQAVLAITSALRPAMLELMDRTSINVVEDHLGMGLDREAGAILIARSDAPGESAAIEAALMEALCRESGATEAYWTADQADGESFAIARRAIGVALERTGKALLLEDVGVPLPALPALVAGVEEIQLRHDVTIAFMAHAGDGNTHPVIVYDATDAWSTANARAAFDAIMALTLSLGGTITGEHGVGRLKRAWLPEYLGPEVMALSRRIKDALDPDGILNPGAVFA
jgi:glycolate oxidase